MNPDQQSKLSEFGMTPERIALEAEIIARQQRMDAAAPVIQKPKPVPPAFAPSYGKCEAHGQFSLNMLDERAVERWLSPVCPACEKQAVVARLMKRAAISPRFERCTFGNFEVKAEPQRLALEICRGYAENFEAHRRAGTCLILRGNPGTGKNHLATAIARRVMEDGFTALNATAGEIIDRIRAAWAPESKETTAGIVDEFAAIDLLIIDEVGRQYLAKDGSESIELFNVIDKRYRLMLPTLVMSNQDRDGLKRFLGEATYDRLREGGGQMANFDWDSARG